MKRVAARQRLGNLALGIEIEQRRHIAEGDDNVRRMRADSLRELAGDLAEMPSASIFQTKRVARLFGLKTKRRSRPLAGRRKLLRPAATTSAFIIRTTASVSGSAMSVRAGSATASSSASSIASGGCSACAFKYHRARKPRCRHRHRLARMERLVRPAIIGRHCLLDNQRLLSMSSEALSSAINVSGLGNPRGSLHR